MWGKSEHLTLKKKNLTSSLKTYLLGLETGSRIFGTMISAKKTAKMQRLIILKQLGKILGVRIYPILRYTVDMPFRYVHHGHVLQVHHGHVLQYRNILDMLSL